MEPKAFSQKNLDAMILNMHLPDVFIESKVQEFLVDLGNDFLEQAMAKSQDISRNLTKKECEPADVKFVLKHMFDIESGRLSHDEVAKSGFRKVNKDLKLNNLKKDKTD